MSDNIILYADSSRGVYIPQFFAQSIKRELIDHRHHGFLDHLCEGPESDFYWDTWCDVLDSVHVVRNGRCWSLHQDGDLFLIDHLNMSEQEGINLFGVDYD